MEPFTFAKTTSRHRYGRVVVMLCLLLSSAVWAERPVAPPAESRLWAVLQNGVFEPDYYSGDGDSFALTATAVSSGAREPRVWRLYGVDCPESNRISPSRVVKQAAYFGVPEEAVLQFGAQASAYTRKFLARGPATVYTIYENAYGLTKKGRSYALVKVNGVDLSLALVSEGLALAGSRSLPDKGPSATAFHQRLREAEQAARTARRGIWSHSTNP